MRILHLVLLLLSLNVSAQTSTAEDMRTSDIKMIETKTSRWIFDAKHEAVARAFLKDFLDIEKELLPVFKEAPERTHFLIYDQTDEANGSATVVPFPLVTLYPVFPNSHSAIGEFDDPAKKLVLHEYTHILNLYPRHGFISWVGWPFGNLARPNQVLPRWMTEGLAVQTESWQGGRLHSQYFEGFVRATTLEKRWDEHSVDTINQGQPDWLGGARPYLLGGAWWQEVVEQKGTGALYKLNQSYSRRIPMLIGGPVEEHVDKSVTEVYEDTIKKISTRGTKQIEAVLAAGHISGKLVSSSSVASYTPSFSPNGRYYAYISRSDHDTRVKIKTRTKGRKTFGVLKKHRHGTTLAGRPSGKISWFSNSKQFILDGTKIFNRSFKYADLWKCKARKLSCSQLTKGLRAHHPAVHPDQKWIYFIQNTPGSNRIAKVNTKGKKLEVSYEPPLQTRIIDIEFLDENNIALLQRKKGQALELLKLNLKNKTATLLQTGLGTSTSLKNTTQGLIFSSSKSGIENLYLLNAQNETSSIKAITNSVTRATGGDIDPLNGALYVVQYIADGPRIFRLAGPQWESFPDTPPKVNSIYPENTKTKRDAASATEVDSFATEDFSSWSYMYPRYWIPGAYMLDGGFAIQAITSAGDPIGRHSYTLGTQWDSLTEKAGVNGIYTYQGMGLPVSIFGGLVYNYYFPLKQAQQQTYGGAALGGFLPGLSNSWSWSLGLNTTTTEIGTISMRRTGPSASLKYTGLSRRGKQISPESGSAFSITHSQYLPDLSNRDYGKTDLNYQLYFNPWARHVFAFNFNGTYAPALRTTPSGFLLSTGTLGVNFTNFTSGWHMLRGYSSGSQVGWNMLTLNAEYRFPIWRVHSGLGRWPFFIKRFNGRFFWDVNTLDGLRYDSKANNNNGDFKLHEFGGVFINGTGFELHSELLIAYHFPLTFVLGGYYGLNQRYQGDFRFFMGVQL